MQNSSRLFKKKTLNKPQISDKAKKIIDDGFKRLEELERQKASPSKIQKETEKIVEKLPQQDLEIFEEELIRTIPVEDIIVDENIISENPILAEKCNLDFEKLIEILSDKKNFSAIDTILETYNNETEILMYLVNYILSKSKRFEPYLRECLISDQDLVDEFNDLILDIGEYHGYQFNKATINRVVNDNLKNIRGSSLIPFKTISNIYRNNFCNGKARKLLKGEYHLGCHNFTGPGTRIDLPEVRNYPPYNDIDACSRQHDIDYSNSNNNPNLIREADEKVINCYNKYPNESGYSAAKLGINSKMKLEDVLPILVKSIAPKYFGKK